MFSPVFNHILGTTARSSSLQSLISSRIATILSQQIRLKHKASGAGPSDAPSFLRHKERLRRQKITEEENKKLADENVTLFPPGYALSNPFVIPKLEGWVVNMKNEKLRPIELNPDTFNQPIRKDLVHRVILWQRSKGRQGTAKTKTKGEVSGSNKKPWKQKGTGRARTGSMRNPHMRGGGRAHGKTPHSWEYALNVKVRRRALKVALTAKRLEGNLHIVERAELDTHKTRELHASLQAFGAPKHALIIHGNEEFDANLVLAGRSHPAMDFIPAKGANVYEIVRKDCVIITETAVKELEARLEGARKYRFVAKPRFTGPSGELPAAYNPHTDAVAALRAQQADNKAFVKAVRA